MIVYDINPDAVNRLVDKGAEGASSVAEVAKASDIVITVLPARPCESGRSAWTG